ncbi:MAG: putative Ig domain-containing protein [Desulfosarcinaceae bacterium]|nr:putative Ig domain-containing protein [Desulfosarcinaceae bacterium]
MKKHFSLSPFLMLFIVLAGLMLSQTANAGVCPESAIGYWRLNENSVGVYGDAINSANGVCSSDCPTNITGVVLNAKRFNGTSTGIRVNARASFDWQPSDSFSIELWVRRSATGLTGDEALIARTDPSTLMRWELVLESDGQLAFSLVSSTGEGTGTVMRSTKILTDSLDGSTRWHHVAVVVDASADFITLYVDGQVEASENIAGVYANGDFASDNAPVTIGWRDSAAEARFGGDLDEIALYNGTLNDTELAGHYLLSRNYCDLYDQEVRILPLGDSITKDSRGPSDTRDVEEKNGYRLPLANLLDNNLYWFDYMGTENDGDPALFDTQHAGWGGIQDDQLSDLLDDGGLPAFLGGGQVTNGPYLEDSRNIADVILLHIGTNELGVPPDTVGVEEVLKEIDEALPHATVLLAQIINRREDADPADRAATTQFNGQLATLAQDRIEQGDKIIVVDMETGAGLNYAVGGSDMFDRLHPSVNGYAKMGTHWFQHLNDFLPQFVTPSISDPGELLATVGILFDFSVQAAGAPRPTFALSGTVPSGMSIDSQGRITWTPASGTSDTIVTVTATNNLPQGTGQDSQPITIRINNRPVAVGDTYTVDAGAVLQIIAANGLLANDSDANSGDTLIAKLQTNPSHGQLTLSDDGGFTYTHNGLSTTTDSFTYIANDGSVDSLPATVTIQVNSTTDVPTITGQATLSTPVDTALRVSLADDLAVEDADSDFPDDFTLTLYPGANYSVQGDTVTPATGFVGTLFVGVSVNDGLNESDRFDLRITVTSGSGGGGGGGGGGGCFVTSSASANPTMAPPVATWLLMVGLLLLMGFGKNWFCAFLTPALQSQAANAHSTPRFGIHCYLYIWFLLKRRHDMKKHRSMVMTCILAAALVLSAGWAPPAFAACPTDLKAYWPLDQNNDPYLEEIEGLNAFCGAGNCPTFVQDGGRVLHGQQFSDGTDNLQVSSNGAQTRPFDWEYNDSVTVEVWFNRSGNLDNGETEVLVGRVDGSTSLLWYIALRRIGGQDKVVIGLRANNGDGSVISGAVNSSYMEGDDDVSDGEWHHVALVKDEDSGSILLYVDGILNDSATVSYADDTDFKSSSANLNIGWLNLGPSFFHFEGILDEVAIFNTAQDADLVEFHQTLGNAGLSICEDQAPQFGADLPTDSALGYEFMFTAQAVGTPPIIYSLKDGASPDNMTIDPDSGEISWIPTDQDTGTISFTVVASNSVGDTEQVYQFDVLDLCATAISAYWQLNETTEPFGDNYDDPATNPNDGACEGACPQNVASDIVGNAKSFNGVDQAISVSTSASAPFNWGPTANFTIEFWMRRDGDLTEGTNGTEVMVGRTSNVPGGLFWFIGLRRFTGETVDRLIVTLRDKNGDDAAPDAAGRQPLESTTDVVDGQWHHIVVVRDDAVGENRLYIDGVLEDTGAVDYDDTLGGFDDGAAALNIGWLNFSPTQTFHFAGRLDELAMYDTALPPSVIDQHFEANPPLDYCNGAPSITSTAVTTVTAGQNYSYQAAAQDAVDEDDTPLLWSLVSGPTGLAVDTATGEVTWSPGAGDAGNNDVSIMVRDQRGGTAVQNFTIMVDAGVSNTAPSITSTAPTSVAPGDTYTYQPTANDPDGDTLTWSLTDEPSGMTIDAATGAISWTPAAGVTTSGTFTLTVDDGAAVDTETITIAVTSNAAPTITSSAPASATVGQRYRYAPVADDAEGDTLAWSLTGAPSNMSLDTVTGVLTWTPAAGDEGDVTFTLTVSDATGSDEQIISITVSAASNGGGGGGGGGGCFIDTTRGSAPGYWGIGLLMAGALFTGLVRRRA